MDRRPEGARADGALAAHVGQAEVFVPAGHVEQAAVAALLVNRVILAQGADGAADDACPATAVVEVEAAFLGISGRNGHLSIEHQAAEAAGATGVGDDHVMQAKAPQAGNDGHALVRPTADQADRVKVVSGRFRCSADALDCQGLNQIGGDAPDEGVRLDISHGPLAGDLFLVSGVGLDHPGGKGQEKGDDRSRARQQVLGQQVGRFGDAAQVGKARIGGGGETDQRLPVLGGGVRLSDLAADGGSDKFG